MQPSFMRAFRAELAVRSPLEWGLGTLAALTVFLLIASAPGVFERPAENAAVPEIVR
jgi:hypothetical protein